MAATRLQDVPPERGTDPRAELVGLVLGAARGDRQAFRELYDRTALALYGVAVTLLRQPELAEAAVQGCVSEDPAPRRRVRRRTWARDVSDGGALLHIRSQTFDR